MTASTIETQHATDALFAWLASAADVAATDAWKAQLLCIISACDDDAVALTELLVRLEHLAGHAERTKWTELVAELGQLQAHGELLDRPHVRLQLLRLRLRFPTSTAAMEIAVGDNRQSAPMLRAVEEHRPSVIWRTTCALRRAFTSEDPDRPLPLLERPTLFSQHSGAHRATMTTRSLITSMSFMLQASLEETFYCFICFEHVPVSRAFALSLCDHRFCRDCLTTYLDVKIRDGDVYPSCFHDVDDYDSGRRVACAAPIIPPDISALVLATAWAKYERFKFNREVAHARQCPYCSHSQACRGPEHPECVCVKCRRSFCYVHSNAHEGGTCADYERRNMETEKLTRSAVARIAKPCPGCQCSVEKSGGCNHMTCIACRTSFCWICGAVVENVAAPDHFAWWNLAGCAGQQLVDVENQSLIERIGWQFFRVLFLFVCVPIGTCVTLVLTALTGCCLPCVFWLGESPKQTFFGTVNTVALYVQLFLAVAILGPISVVALLLRCVRSCFCTCCYWSSPPMVSMDLDSRTPSVFVLEMNDEIAIDDAFDSDDQRPFRLAD